MIKLFTNNICLENTKTGRLEFSENTCELILMHYDQLIRKRLWHIQEIEALRNFSKNWNLTFVALLAFYFHKSGILKNC